MVEVWHLDLASFDSVKEFCKRIESIDRIDILIANAGIATPKFELVEGFESTIAVNVISTFLVITLLIPKMKESGERFGAKSRVVVVTSDAHHMLVVLSYMALLHADTNSGPNSLKEAH